METNRNLRRTNSSNNSIQTSKCLTVKGRRPRCQQFHREIRVLLDLVVMLTIRARVMEEVTKWVWTREAQNQHHWLITSTETWPTKIWVTNPNSSNIWDSLLSHTNREETHQDSQHKKLGPTQIEEVFKEKGRSCHKISSKCNSNSYNRKSSNLRLTINSRN